MRLKPIAFRIYGLGVFEQHLNKSNGFRMQYFKEDVPFLDSLFILGKASKFVPS